MSLIDPSEFRGLRKTADSCFSHYFEEKSFYKVWIHGFIVTTFPANDLLVINPESPWLIPMVNFKHQKGSPGDAGLEKVLIGECHRINKTL